MISSLRLQHFRSYTDESFEFEPGINIVVGPNGAGKTNLLEAILVLARGNSYRVRDNGLMKFGAPWSRLDGFFDSHTRTLKLEAQDDLVTKTLLLGDKALKRLSLSHTLPIVVFEPNQLALLTRGPSQRREYLDDLLVRSEPGYNTLIRSYARVLAERNALLKRGSTNAQQQLFVWNIRLSELGGKIVATRQKLVDEINQTISKSYSAIAKHPSELEVRYEARFDPKNYSSKMLAKLEQAEELDFMRGFTAYGPHREDLSFFLNGQHLAQSASRGETRSLLLALKIFELKLLEKTTKQKPMFLLDDVFSELDGARRKALVRYLKKYQTIITTTDADIVIKYFTQSHNVIPLR